MDFLGLSSVKAGWELYWVGGRRVALGREMQLREVDPPHLDQGKVGCSSNKGSPHLGCRVGLTAAPSSRNE